MCCRSRYVIERSTSVSTDPPIQASPYRTIPDKTRNTITTSPPVPRTISVDDPLHTFTVAHRMFNLRCHHQTYPSPKPTHHLHPLPNFTPVTTAAQGLTLQHATQRAPTPKSSRVQRQRCQQNCKLSARSPLTAARDMDESLKPGNAQAMRLRWMQVSA